MTKWHDLLEKYGKPTPWPYPIHYDKEQEIEQIIKNLRKLKRDAPDDKKTILATQKQLDERKRTLSEMKMEV